MEKKRSCAGKLDTDTMSPLLKKKNQQEVTSVICRAPSEGHLLLAVEKCLYQGK